jgi:hypothetical protein
MGYPEDDDILVVCPDRYVGTVVPLDEPSALDTYFAGYIFKQARFFYKRFCHPCYSSHAGE